MNRLAGKVALITGAASGLGFAGARRFIAEGARVALTDRDPAVEARAAELGDHALAIAHDVTDEEQWIAAFAAAVERFGKVDIVVNSAGVATESDVENCTIEEYRWVNAVNNEGVFLGCKHGVRTIKQTGEPGAIINISSVAGLVGIYNLAAYNASKGAVRLLTKSVALHCAHAGYPIRCNSLHPAYLLTPMVQAGIDRSKRPERYREKLEAVIPMRRLGEPDDAAHAMVYLASDESRFITGAELAIDGGFTAA